MPVTNPDCSDLTAPTMSRRALLGSALAASIVGACATARRSPAPLVLFVCQYGTAKSAIARELFRRRVRQRHLAIEAFSRGLTIEDHLTPGLRQRLAADGIDPAVKPAQVLQVRDWQRASIVVAFNPLPLEVPRTKVRDWTNLPSITDDYANTRAILDRRLEALIDELGARV